MAATDTSGQIDSPTIARIAAQIASELAVGVAQVRAALVLLDDGATVPFIARYRKEATGNLDDTQLRNLEERLEYLRELEARRAAIMHSIHEQGKLSDSLAAAIAAAPTKQVLEDLYLPYRPKRRTRAQIARDAGLEPLADALYGDPHLDPAVEALRYVNGLPPEEHGVADVRAALDGARDILAERFAETAPLLAQVREHLWHEGALQSLVVAGKEAEDDEKFRDYYDYSEAIRLIPSHRALALFRGKSQGILGLKLALPEALEAQAMHPCVAMIAAHFKIAPAGRPGDPWLADVCRWTWRVKMSPQIEQELLERLRETAENEAIRVFARNLHALLLAAPAGATTVLGLDPGIRTGCKVAVVDRTGKLLATETIYPHEPRRDWSGSLATLARLTRQFEVDLVAIGNGTASRETERLVADLAQFLAGAESGRTFAKVIVSEAGASVYSASQVAADEFPDVDVTLRGAVSIARRLQDPLAELVKIDPKSIGVGQYQHDVNQRALARALDAVVEDCVNAVGVDLNTASVPLLARVSGLNRVLAQNIVSFRDSHGPFANRRALLAVPRVGEKTFEQAAGFLRITGGDDPLDRSAVHPEAYPVVERILAKLGCGIDAVMGHPELLKGISATAFVDERFGLPTVRDILSELEKPGRDPRGEFRTARFEEGVAALSDLKPGMMLEGVVTNVTAFGAFVDIGVHQDGLVHVSAMADKFVKDPHEVVKPGQIVRVRVIEVDEKRRRIALSMRREEPAASVRQSGPSRGEAKAAPRSRESSRSAAPGGNAMSLAFEKLRRR